MKPAEYRHRSGTRNYKEINRHIGKAIHQYNMIDDGDRILVGLSGGKDSLTLMWFLTQRLQRIQIRYELIAVYIDPGFTDGFAAELDVYCRKNDYHLIIEKTDYGIISHSSLNKENPCFLCARLRRKRLFEIAAETKCFKIALGHHKDDLIETLFINMCYAGEMSTMRPSESFFNGKFTVIRPLAFTDEKIVSRFAKDQCFPEFSNPCPSATTSKRREIKNILNQLYFSNRKIKGNIFHAMRNVKTDYLL